MDLTIRVFCNTLTSEVNEMKNSKYTESFDASAIIEIEKKISHRFLILADYLNYYTDLKYECILTAFSMNPTIENFNIICVHAKRTKKICYEYIDDGNKSNKITNDITLMESSPQSQDVAKKLLSETVQRDLITLVNVSRLKNLTWNSSWSKLESECLELLNTEKKRTIIENSSKQLQYLNINYDDIRNLRAHEYPGIESGYEIYVNESNTSGSEDDTDSAPESRPHKLREAKRQSAKRSRRIRQSRQVVAKLKSTDANIIESAKPIHKKSKNKSKIFRFDDEMIDEKSSKFNKISLPGLIDSETIKISNISSDKVTAQSMENAQTSNNGMEYDFIENRNDSIDLSTNKPNKIKRGRPSITENVMQICGEAFADSQEQIKGNGMDILRDIIGEIPNILQHSHDSNANQSENNEVKKQSDCIIPKYDQNEQNIHKCDFLVSVSNEKSNPKIQSDCIFQKCDEKVQKDHACDFLVIDSNEKSNPSSIMPEYDINARNDALPDHVHSEYNENFHKVRKNVQPPYKDSEINNHEIKLECNESSISTINISDAIKQSIFVVGETIDCNSENEIICQNISQENYSPPTSIFFKDLFLLSDDFTAKLNSRAFQNDKKNPLRAYRINRKFTKINASVKWNDKTQSQIKILTNHCTVKLVPCEKNKALSNCLNQLIETKEEFENVVSKNRIKNDFLGLKRYPKICLPTYDGNIILQKIKILIPTRKSKVINNYDRTSQNRMDFIRNLKRNRNVQNKRSKLLISAHDWKPNQIQYFRFGRNNFLSVDSETLDTAKVS